MRSSARFAFTIIEVLVVASLLLLLFGLVLKVLVPAMRYSAEGNIRVELQQQGILTLNRMVSDLQLTVPQGITFKTSSPAAMAINKMGALSGGYPSWQGSVILYHYDDVGGILYWEEDTITPPTSAQPYRLSPGELTGFISTAGGEERVLARNVTAFELSPQVAYQNPIPPATQPTPAQPLTIRIVLQREVPHTPKKARVELVRSVYLRNSL